MAETFLPQNYMFDFETANEAGLDDSVGDQSANIILQGMAINNNPQFTKSEPQSPLYYDQNLVGNHHYTNDHEKQYDNFFTELSMSEIELQAKNNNNNNNNNNSSESSLISPNHCTWTHQGLLSSNPPNLTSPAHHHHHHQFVQSYKQSQSNPVQPMKKGRGGRKKSTRYKILKFI